MKQFLKTKSSITAWLDKHKIKNYTLVGSAIYGYKVDVKGDVNLSSFNGFFHKGSLKDYSSKFRVKRFVQMPIVGPKNLKFIPVKFNKIKGNFNTSVNNLRTMIAMPKIVIGRFDIFSNRLKNLKGLPKIIGAAIDLGANRLRNLVGAPRVVYGDFSAGHNYTISSLIGAPKIVHGNFLVSCNPLTSLKGSPRVVKGSYICRNNNLTSLQGISLNVGKHLIIKDDKYFNDCYQNHFKDFDYLPKKIGGEIEFSSTGGLVRYQGMMAKEIIETVKTREKQKKIANKEKLTISQELEVKRRDNLNSAKKIKNVAHKNKI